VIVRIVRGRVDADLVPSFHDLARSTVPEVRLCDGVVSVSVARQIASDGAEEIVFTTVWRDLPALYEWLGGSDLLDVPAPICGFEKCLSGRDLQYYEVIATDLAIAPSGAAPGR
jgi:quinol monooxygenase YgiN